MPVIVVQALGGEAPERPRVTLLAQATVTSKRAVLLARVRTGSVRSRAGISALVKTRDLTLTPLPPLPAVPAGDVVHGPSRAFLVTHAGLPIQAESFTVGNARANGEARDRPTFSAELRGKLALSGGFSLVVTSRSLTGEGDYLQAYGPFSKVGVTYTQTPTGWKTSLASSDTTAADAEKIMPIITEEFLPWEKENDLTNLQQAAESQGGRAQGPHSSRTSSARTRTHPSAAAPLSIA